MTSTRHQDPAIKKRTDCPRHFWYIRPYINLKTERGLVRKQRRIPLGYCDETSLREAKIQKQRVMSEINSSKKVLQEITFGRVIDRYLEGAFPLLGAGTRTKYERLINVRVKPSFGSRQMREVDTLAVQTLINGATTLGYFGKRDLRAVISAIFSFAIETDLWSEANPCARVRCGKRSFKYEKKLPTPQQFQAFLENLPDVSWLITGESARLMVLVAALGGLRVSEVLGLQVRDIDLASETLSVTRRWYRGDLDLPKTESSRRTRYVGALAALLAKHAAGKQPHAFLFACKDGQPPDGRHLQEYVFRRAAERCGCYHPGFGMHVFRRLFVTWRQQFCGSTPIEAQKTAGHGSLNMTFLYSITDSASERERDQVNRLWDRIKPADIPAPASE